MSQPAPSLLLRPSALARLSMPDLRLSALLPFSRGQKKPCATTRLAKAARSLRAAASLICLRKASKLASAIGFGNAIATGLYGRARAGGGAPRGGFCAMACGMQAISKAANAKATWTWRIRIFLDSMHGPVEVKPQRR